MAEPVVIERWADTPFGMFGTLTYKAFSCFWMDPSLPAGSYRLQKVLHRNLPTYQITPTGCVIRDTAGEGCVLGLRLGAVDVPDENDPLHRRQMQWAVLDSKKAHAAFMEALAGENDLPLAIRWR